MKKLFTLLIIILSNASFSILVAQTNSINVEGSRINVRMFNNGDTNSEADGTPYIGDKFRPAKINGGSTIYKVRYNAYQDNFEVQLNSGIIVLDESSQKSVQLKLLDEDIIFDYVSSKNVDYNYLELLWKNGDKKLYKGYSINYQAATVGNGYTKSQKAKFSEPEIEYFYFDGTFKELPRSKRKLFKLFFDGEMRGYAKKSSLNIKEEIDLIKLLNEYYD